MSAEGTVDQVVDDVIDGSQARIIDRGYRRYDGERTGVRGAMWATTRHAVQRSLGLRRTFWAKVLPIASVAIAYLPAIVFVGIVALIPAKDITDFVVPTYGQYYGFIVSAIVLYVAFVAPEVLCSDRRTGMLGIYLASPLDRRTYFAAKAAAIGFALSLVCLGPPLFLLIANVLQSNGPQGVGDTLLTLVRVLGAGVAITALFTGLSMGVSSLTDRKMIATAGVVIVVVMTFVVVGTLVGVARYSTNWRALSPVLLSESVAARSHGEDIDLLSGAPSALVWGAWAAWTFGGFGIAWARIRTLAVTR